MLRLLCLMLASLWLCPGAALALDPDTRLSQYAHSAWRIQDGSLGGAPGAIVQTADGYVWIGTSTGLVRFDGVRFVAWKPADGDQWLSSNSVWSLLGARDGTLWIGTGSNLARLKNGRLFNYTNGRGRINAIVEDQRGAVWISRSRVRDDAGPLCEVTGDTLRCYGKADGMPLPTGGPLMVDAGGTFWVGNANALVQWSGGSSRTHMTRQLQPAAGLSGVISLAYGADGSIWSGMSRTGPGLGLQRLQDGTWQPITAPDFDGTTLSVNTLFRDRRNAMWIGTEGHGLYRFAAGRMDRFSRADGLSGDSVTALHEDREGNMWVATSDGIDCFRDTRMISYSTLEGLSANQISSVLAARDGTIWAGNPLALEGIRGHQVTSINQKQGLPGSSVTSLLEDHAGRLWLGVDSQVAVYEQGRFRRIMRADGSGPGPMVAMIEDRAHTIWGLAIGTPRRLVRIENFAVREEIAVPQLPAAGSLAPDPEDGIWLGLDSGSLARYRKGQLETFRFAPAGSGAVDAGSVVRQVMGMADGTVMGARMDGLIGWRNGTSRTLTTANGLPCGGMYAFVFDAQNTLWLYTQCGLLSIADAELRKWWERGDTVVKVNAFDTLDGVRPGISSFQPRASRSPDGRLWFANETVVQMIDPARQAANAIPPPVHIEQVVADRKSYPVTPVVQLPPLTGDLEIDYVGLSFVAPQKVRFRYRLEGRDQTWQEPGTRRQAFYNDLRPGTYRFRVIASNNDGLERRGRRARDRHPSGLVSDERVPGVVRHQRDADRVGPLSIADASGGARAQRALRRAAGGTHPHGARPSRHAAADRAGQQDGRRQRAEPARRRVDAAGDGAGVRLARTSDRGRPRGGERTPRFDTRKERSRGGVPPRDRRLRASGLVRRVTLRERRRPRDASDGARRGLPDRIRSHPQRLHALRRRSPRSGAHLRARPHPSCLRQRRRHRSGRRTRGP